jgi:hypothetical protein
VDAAAVQINAEAGKYGPPGSAGHTAALAWVAKQRAHENDPRPKAKRLRTGR